MATVSIPFSDKIFKRFKSVTSGILADESASASGERLLAELRLRALEMTRAWEAMAAPLPDDLDWDAQTEERTQRRIHFDYSQSLYNVSLQHSRKHLRREGVQAGEALQSTIEVSIATNDFSVDSNKRIQNHFELLRSLAA